MQGKRDDKPTSRSRVESTVTGTRMAKPRITNGLGSSPEKVMRTLTHDESLSIRIIYNMSATGALPSLSSPRHFCFSGAHFLPMMVGMALVFGSGMIL